MAKVRNIRYYTKDQPYQQQFQDSVKPKVYLSTGYGGGKSHALCMKGLKLGSINRGLPGGLLCPNLKMFKRDVHPLFEEICDNNRLHYKYHRQDSYLYFKDTKTKIYLFHDEDKGESIRGPNLAFMLINEVTLTSEPGFKAALARVRLKKAKLRQVAMSGTPEGFSWHYDYFIENPREDTDLIFGDMRCNKFIADDYAQMLYDSYDKKMVEQYVKGLFVNLIGNRAAWSFDRHKHTADGITKHPYGEIWVTLDFNVDPMGATLWNRVPVTNQRDISRGLWLEAFDEICINGASTYDVAREIRERVSPDDHVVIFPDPAGKARSTKAKDLKSDIKILEDAGFDDIRYKSRIKSTKDCLNAWNNLLDKGRVKIGKQCRQTIADMEQCKLVSGTFEIDKSNIKRTHWLDGIKNMADYEFPIRARRGHWSKKVR